MHDDSAQTLMNADRRSLVRAATRLLGPSEAEDAVQDAYVRALETDPTGLNAAQAWMLTVVRHLAIDRLRRRAWMQQWVEATQAQDSGSASSPASTALISSTASTAPSAETVATLAEEVAHALRLMAAHLTPMEGAALLLHEVFEVEHAEIAHANGQSEAASRQRLRRTLARLRQAGSGSAGAAPRHADVEPDAGEDAVFRQYLDSLRLRDPRSLWAMLRRPPISAMAPRSGTATATTVAASAPAPSSSVAASGVLQVGGQLGLVLTLDGVT
ncbi:sigma-70 family RNA polymerase sigma factor [Mitsuaria sp. 7]|uniref:sigma-70 family RNA polymerase sigma factor n=1 Tax=Mitsuaria sp. 7 TaxID=1658665 RepID=UPI0007DCE86E|nr:sigma-70 family RNA polymerase sigma factor [Mitsuaria sp. 7]ANH68002.1 RNA polymerase subunit sigma-24 [Mitsuaria sp. 7]